VEQTEYIQSEDRNINIKAIGDFARDHWPRTRIPYKFIVLPGLIIFFLLLGSSFIKPPHNISPVPGSTISRTPVIRFNIVRNLLYQGYEAGIKYANGGEIQQTVSEGGGGVISIYTPAILNRQSGLVLTIKIKKGMGPVTFWSKEFKYSYTTGFN
jgi:hypothetical protein